MEWGYFLLLFLYRPRVGEGTDEAMGAADSNRRAYAELDQLYRKERTLT